MVETAVLQNVLIAIALGAIVGMEREKVPENKYAGLRTLTLLCASGPISVLITQISGSILPVTIYLLLSASFSVSIIYIRMRIEGEDLGLTTSATVFLMALVGLLVGYSRYFEAVAVTLMTVFLLIEKDFFKKYLERMSSREISDAVKLGIIAFVLYPLLPAGAVDPYGVLFLRKALLFVIFILLVQFAAYVSLKWREDDLGFMTASSLGGVVSSLAVVSTMADYVKKGDLKDYAHAAATASSTTMVLRNAAIAAVLAPSLLGVISLPYASAVVLGSLFVLSYKGEGKRSKLPDFSGDSPFSFVPAFKLGSLFLVILLISELLVEQFSSIGLYGTALIGGIGSSMAVVASAATLLGAGKATTLQASGMISLSVISSLFSKLIYTESERARELTLKLVPPYIAMSLAVLLVFL